MIRRCSCLAGVLWMLLSMGIPVYAAQGSGVLRVCPVWCGTPIAGGTVSLYRVGEQMQQGIRITDGLADWDLEEADLKSETWIGWMMQRKGEPVQTAAVGGETGAIFEDLEKGIYLVEQREAPAEYAAFRPFFQTIPDGGDWDLAVTPRLIRNTEPPQTGDRPAPIIGAMGIGLSAAILMVLADRYKK